MICAAPKLGERIQQEKGHDFTLTQTFQSLKIINTFTESWNDPTNWRPNWQLQEQDEVLFKIN